MEDYKYSVKIDLKNVIVIEGVFSLRRFINGVKMSR